MRMHKNIQRHRQLVLQQCWVEFCGRTTQSTRHISRYLAYQQADVLTAPALVYIHIVVVAVQH